MKSKAQALKRLKRLYNAVRACAVNDRDRRPKVNLDSMSKRYVFNAAQERRNLTGSLINIEVYSRLVVIARGIAVAGGATVAIACGTVAYFNIDVALRAAIILLIGGGVVGYRVRAYIDSLLNFDKLVAFMADIDKAASLLNPIPTIGTQDPLKWLRCSADDLSAHAAHVIKATIERGQLDEVKHQIKLFVSLGLVTGEPLRNLKRLAEAKATVTVV